MNVQDDCVGAFQVIVQITLKVKPSVHISKTHVLTHTCLKNMKYWIEVLKLCCATSKYKQLFLLI